MPLNDNEYFQYLEDIYAQQAHSLEGLKCYVRLPDDDADLLAFARIKNYRPVARQPEWAEKLAEVFGLRWTDRDKKRTTYYCFDEHVTMNVFNATYDDGGSSVFEVTLDGEQFGVEFIARFDGRWQYEVKWVKEEELVKMWLQAPKVVIAVHSANDVYLEPERGWVKG